MTQPRDPLSELLEFFLKADLERTSASVADELMKRDPGYYLRVARYMEKIDPALYENLAQTLNQRSIEGMPIAVFTATLCAILAQSVWQVKRDEKAACGEASFIGDLIHLMVHDKFDRDGVASEEIGPVKQGDEVGMARAKRAAEHDRNPSAKDS